MPPKTFSFNREQPKLQPLILPAGATVSEHLGKCFRIDTSKIYQIVSSGRVLRLMSVGSKRFLTNKVDRSVTGLVAQQQCVGGLHTPVSDVAVIGMSYTSTQGAATSVGEQPIKGFIDPKARVYTTLNII